MPFIRRSNYWLVMAAFVAAFWITFRVMAAPLPSPAPQLVPADLVPPDDEEIRDPALEVMIARFAGEARTQGDARNGL